MEMTHTNSRAGSAAESNKVKCREIEVERRGRSMVEGREDVNIRPWSLTSVPVGPLLSVSAV